MPAVFRERFIRRDQEARKEGELEVLKVDRFGRRSWWRRGSLDVTVEGEEERSLEERSRGG